MRFKGLPSSIGVTTGAQPRRVELWVASHSVAGVVDPVTRGYGVGLFSCRGESSKTFAYNSAMAYQQIDGR
jgi:hypothetical protein